MILDTHVLVWLMQGEGRLGTAARERIDSTARGTGVLVPAITIWEVAMLAHKGRLNLGREVGSWVGEALAKPGLKLVPLEPAIAIDSVRLPGSFHGDPADRLIIATARHLGRPLITADRAILAYGVTGFLQVIDAGV